jgi:cleavage and polyadenylation specificity factor subunit 1
MFSAALQPLRLHSTINDHIRHISGKGNVITDTLSGVESVTASPSHDALVVSQDSDDELRTLLASNNAPRLEKQQIRSNTVSIYCNTSAGKSRPYVQPTLRLQVFQSVHDLSHPGIKATAKLVALRLVWPGMKDCRTRARVCQACQRSKVCRHTFTPVGDFALTAAHFLNVHILCRAPSNVSRLHIQPHCRRPLHALAKNHPPSGQHSRDRDTRPLDRLDIPLRLPTDLHRRPGMSVWVATLPLPG